MFSAELGAAEECTIVCQTVRPRKCNENILIFKLDKHCIIYAEDGLRNPKHVKIKKHCRNY